MYVSLFWAIVLLLVPGSKNRPKHFLGFFMVAATMVYFSHATFFSHQHSLYLLVDPIYIFATLSVYPLYYWFIRLLTVDAKYQVKNLWHLAPAIGFSLIVTVLYLKMNDPLGYVQTHLFNQSFVKPVKENLWMVQKTIFQITRVVMFLQIIWYLYHGLKLIKIYEFRLKDFYSNLEGRSIDWAKWLMIIFSVTAVMSSVANALGRSFFNDRSFWLIFPSLIFSVLLFFIGYLGHVQSHSFYDLKKDEDDDHSSGTGNGTHQIDMSEPQESKIYLIPLKKQLISLFEDERIYRQHDLKIIHISQILKTNRTYVSKLINEEFGCPFSDFVNQYRLNEVKEIIIQNAEGQITLDELAERTGFTSASSLIRVFKQLEGVTPGIFRDRYKTNS